MGRYLDIANGIPQREPEIVSQSADATDLSKPDTENARRLLGAGWKPKVSFFEQVIWERPDTGFYVSEEMALHLLDAKNVRSKSGANDRR